LPSRINADGLDDGVDRSLAVALLVEEFLGGIDIT